MKNLALIFILGTAVTACQSTRSGGYNDGYYGNDGYGYSDDYVEYNGQRVRKTPAYIECERRDNNDQLIGAGIGAVVGGVVGNEIDKGEGTAIGAVGGAAAGAAIANKNCDKYLDPYYNDGRYGDSQYGDRGYTVNGVTYYNERDVRDRINFLQAEDRRLSRAPDTRDNRIQRDRIRDEIDELYRAERAL